MIGRLLFFPPEDRWEWSPEVYDLLGFSPGEVVPSTAVLRAHLDETGARALDGWTGEHTGPEHVALFHEVRGVERSSWVLSTWETPPVPTAPRRLCLIDLTREVTWRAAQEAGTHIRAGVESRSRVDQAVGVLVATYGLDPQEAFGLLRWFSTRRNDKLRSIAERIADGHVGPRTAGHPSGADREALLNSLVLDRPRPAVTGISGAGFRPLAVHTDEPSDQDGTGATRCVVSGTVDLARTPELTAALEDLAERFPEGPHGAPRVVLLDLADAVVCTAAAVEVERFVTRMRRRGTTVTLREHP
ncbi:MAG: ANTAR domain-containing protein [Nocardioides sp.]|nr:ANTAR domain-containing protein [Nocardioides sp.]